MRKVDVGKIRNAVFELCIKSNFYLRPDIKRALKKALKKETHGPTRRVFSVLLDNAEIAKKEKRALCQDTGIVSVYIGIGQDVRLTGGDVAKAVNLGVREAYKKMFLRKSVVKSPLLRKNTATNTPSIIYAEVTKGDRITLSIMPKGFGSENKSMLKMLNPADGEKEIVSFACDVVKAAGPDACPPYILGMGIGGTFDRAATMAKKALLLPIDRPNPKKHLRNLEKAILREINKLKIGPMGPGAKTTCLGVNIIEYPTHIAGLPVAVNVGCHAMRSASKII